MQKRKVAVGIFTKSGEEVFTGAVDKVGQDMTGNTNYTALASEVTAMKTSFDTYKVARANAVKGGVEATAIRDARRADLVELVQRLANNASAIANGDEEMLMSSGFPLQKAGRTPIGPLPAPQAPFLRQGDNSGKMKAFTPPIYGGALYTTRLALTSAPTVYVQTKQSTGARFEFEGLTPGELYNGQMMVVGAAGPSDWSDNSTLRIV
jgi:hypothetical protein